MFRKSDSEDVIQNDIEEPFESPDPEIFIVSSTENLFHDDNWNVLKLEWNKMYDTL